MHKDANKSYHDLEWTHGNDFEHPNISQGNVSHILSDPDYVSDIP